MDSFLKSLPDNFELYEFKLEKVLGQGGFGITYLALDMNLMQHVAIKEYYPREFANRDSTFTIHAVGNSEDKDTFAWGLKRFLDEARVLAQLSHPNVISIKRFFEAHGTAYLVMEYCDGKPLDEIIRDHGPLNEPELNGILFPLLDGLEHVHEKSFLHRDIKPSNIFIKRNGSPVLLDFGAAKNEMTTHSKSVTSLATAGYAPFEQYSTKGKQGTWSDIYGLAATIYRSISGVKPQEAPDRMLEDTLVPAADLLKGKFSPSLLMALDKALSIRPEARPQTIAEFRKLIEDQPSFALNDELPNVESPTASDKPESKVHAQQQFVEIESISIEADQAKRKLSENKPRKNKYLIISIGVGATLVGFWLFFTTSEKQKLSIVEAPVRTEAQVAEKASPVVMDAAPVIPLPSVIDRSAKPPLAISAPAAEEKKITPPPKPALSFAEIDSAIEAGQLGKAYAMLKDATSSYPDNAGIYFRMGQIFASEDKYPEAREQLNRAKKIDPSLRFTAPGKFQELFNEILAMEKMSKLPGRE
jgi:serine/threonine protein kinase